MKKSKMYRVLVYHEKNGDCYVSARTPEEMEKAYLYIFKLMDDMGYYEEGLTAAEKTVYDTAKAGDGRSAKRLINHRNGCEYECVDVEWVVVPE